MGAFYFLLFGGHRGDEGVVQDLKTNLLRKALWLDPGALREAISGFVQHYHDERPHQALDNRPPAGPQPSQGTPPTRIQRWDRVGGLISVYRSAAT